MRRRSGPFFSLLLALTALVAGCGGAAAGDPYEILADSMEASWDPIQINVGFSVQDGDETFSVDPSAIGVVVDEAAGTGGLHVSVPAEDLDLDPMLLGQLGISGDSIDFDLVFDGDALYGKSPLLGAALEVLLAGDVPAGDLSGWLRIASAADLAGLAELAGDPSTMPLPSIPAAGDAKALKTELEKAGITLTNAGSEQRDGKDASHLTVAIDAEKLLASEVFDTMTRVQLEEARAALEEFELTADLWIETSSKHLIEVAITGDATATDDQSFEVVVRFGDPDGSISTEAPGDFVELPVDELIRNVMDMIGEGLIGA